MQAVANEFCLSKWNDFFWEQKMHNILIQRIITIHIPNAKN